MSVLCQGWATHVGVTGGLVGAGGELELVGGLEVGVAGGAVGGGVLAEVEHKLEHFDWNRREKKVTCQRSRKTGGGDKFEHPVKPSGCTSARG